MKYNPIICCICNYNYIDTIHKYEILNRLYYNQIILTEIQNHYQLQNNDPNICDNCIYIY